MGSKAQEKIKELEAEMKRLEEEDAKARVYFPETYVTSTGRLVIPILLDNTKAVVDHFEMKVRYNEMSKEREMIIPSTPLHSDLEANNSLFLAQDLCRKNAYNISRTDLDAHVSLVADANAYHPVKDWIDSAKWDGKDRLEEFYETVSSPHPMKKTLIKRWLLSCVAAIYEKDGIAAQGMLVLVGAQGLGKTSWVNSLVSDKNWVKDGVILNTKDKDSILKVVAHWIVEIGELGSTFKKSDVDELKAFMTEKVDIVRPPYMPKANKYARRTILFGSVDRREFLVDDENRRFWTLDVDGLTPFHDIDVQQLWSQVYEMYQQESGKKGGDVCWILTREELNGLREHNESFKSIDPLEQLLQEHVSEPSEVPHKDGKWRTATGILLDIGFTKSQIRKVHTNKVASWCRSKGFQLDKEWKKFYVCVDMLAESSFDESKIRLPKSNKKDNHLHNTIAELMNMDD